MKQFIEETSIARAAAWKDVVHIDGDIVLADHLADLPVPTDARRMNLVLIVLCTRGSLQYTVDTRETVVTAGEMLVVSERHVVNNYQASPDIEGMAILLSLEFNREIISNVSELSAAFLFARTNPVIRLTPNESDIFCRYFNAIKNRISDLGNRFRKALVRTLLLALFYDLSNVIYREQQGSIQPRKRAEAIFTRFVKLVEQHYRHERRVTWYAQQLGISSKYLSETIKNASQRTPNEWIDNYVVLELRVMLKNTTKSIKQITEEMNFPNQSFLGKYFKEHVGISPSEYRKG